MSGLKRFHDDERGLEAMQVVMIIAIAALILALVKSFWTTIKDWAQKLVDGITGWTS